MRLKAFIPARRDLARASSNLIVILPTKDIIESKVLFSMSVPNQISNLVGPPQRSKGETESSRGVLGRPTTG